MTKKILSISLLAIISVAAFFSCKKSNNGKVDLTRNYFPVKIGKSVTYAVDSIYYNAATCTRYEIKSQQKYVITDSTVDNTGYLPVTSYIMTVYSRPYNGALWKVSRVIILTPTATSLLYAQDNAQFIKLIFPIEQGAIWEGNTNNNFKDPAYAYLNNWNYSYLDYHKSYNNGLVNFDNTVTVLETDQSVNYPNYDSLVDAYRIYAKEVYAYNVGMIYKEWTYWTYKPNKEQCKNGYTVIMQAIDHN
jgi:hypothetical protein